MSGTKLEDCFNENGNLKFDPYRCDRDDHRYQLIFDGSGFLKNPEELAKLIDKKKWGWKSVAVGLYHADILALSTKGSYPTIYYYR